MSQQILHIKNWIDGKFSEDFASEFLEKIDPHTGEICSYFENSSQEAAHKAIESAQMAFRDWSEMSPVQRGKILFNLVDLLKENREELSKTVAIETGKILVHAAGEVNAAISVGEFFASEGMRLYARSLTSGTKDKHVQSVRQPVGIAALIVPANTPIANIAWKIFPALICGNSVILKSSEDAPQIAAEVVALSAKVGLPKGVLNLIHGKGEISGKALVEDPRVDVISFTGSTAVGRWISKVAGERLARVSLELGGKNALVVCNDADLGNAVEWACASAFSNAGQRCASGSRMIVHEDIYDQFMNLCVKKAQSLKLGVDDDCYLGPVINKRQHEAILSIIEESINAGGVLKCGGKSPDHSNLKNGFYIEPTIIEGLSMTAKISCKEIFGPVATVYKFKTIQEALELTNQSEYGLTAAIHTKNIDKATWFAHRVRTGVININSGTFGSEPHMPFGGFGSSGNGTREPGTEALDVYTELKNISVLVNLNNLN